MPHGKFAARVPQAHEESKNDLLQAQPRPKHGPQVPDGLQEPQRVIFGKSRGVFYATSKLYGGAAQDPVEDDVPGSCAGHSTLHPNPKPYTVKADLKHPRNHEPEI